MTAREMKIKTFSLIEEYYPEKKGLVDDEDILKKINGIINSVMYELATIKKIPAKYSHVVTKNDNKLEIKKIPDIFQLNTINNINYEVLGDYEIEFILDEDIDSKNIDIYYYKYPAKMELEFEPERGLTSQEVSDEYDEGFEFELSEDTLEIMPYGIASDLLKNDMITNYGRYFNDKYEKLKQQLNTNLTSGVVNIVGGIDI